MRADDRLSRCFQTSALLTALCTATIHCSSDDSTPSPPSAIDGGQDAGADDTADGALPDATAEAAVTDPDAATERFDDLYIGCRDPMLGTIQHYRISTTSGVVAMVDSTLANAQVSNSAWNADENLLYVAHTDIGRISTFRRDPTTGTLTLQGAVVVPGNPDMTMNPATQTLEIDHTGKFLLAANYTANTVLVYALGADGAVGALVETVTDGLNAHHTVLNNTNKFALVPYLGSNVIAVYDFDESTGMLAPHTPLTTAIPVAGSGPRHLALHRNAKWLYAITENAGTIEFFHFDNDTGALVHQAAVSSLPATFMGPSKSGSEIEIDATGRFLYVSNRLDPMTSGILGAYSISQTDGTLTPIEFYDTKGFTPRQFSLSPDGKVLVVGNQGSANMSVFKVDATTGALTYVATTPVCEVPFFARMIER